MIFSLTDETYSLMCFYKDDEKTDDKTLFYIFLLNQLYWILGTVIGISIFIKGGERNAWAHGS